MRPHRLGCVEGMSKGRFVGSRARNHVKRFSEMAVAETAENSAERLARFFPGAAAVRIPVRVTAVRPGDTRLSEATILEYGAADHAIFVCTLPLEFDDRVRLERTSASGVSGPRREAVEAAVIAVQYHEGNKAVAVRFLKGPCNWVMEP